MVPITPDHNCGCALFDPLFRNVADVGDRDDDFPEGKRHRPARRAFIDHFASRLATAGCAVWFYLFKLLLPVNIIFNYPRWDIRAWGVAGFLPLVALAVVFGTLFYLRNTPCSAQHLAAMADLCGHCCCRYLGFYRYFLYALPLVSDHWQYQASLSDSGLASPPEPMGLYRKVGGIGSAGGIWANALARCRRVWPQSSGAALLTYTFTSRGFTARPKPSGKTLWPTIPTPWMGACGAWARIGDAATLRRCHPALYAGHAHRPGHSR